MNKKFLSLKKREDQRIRSGHPWIFSNEIDSHLSPLKSFTPGEEVTVLAHDKSALGTAYINPHSLIAGRLFSRQTDVTLDEAFFIYQLQQALTLRDRLFNNPYYRLLFSEADNLPGVVIDRFNQHLVVQINTAGIDKRTELLISALLHVLPDTQSILLRNDSTIRTQEGLEKYTKPVLGTPPESVELEENGVRFLAPLLSGQKTGWFYDHRMNRARLQNYVPNKSVLDVFSYVGGWGIQAAVFGAASVTCIDASAAACDYIKQNARLNQVDSKVTAICDDAFDAMKQLNQTKAQYDVIVLDPPAFVKRAKDHKEGIIAYQRANELALKLLAPDGILISCSCSMHVSMDDLHAAIRRAANRTQSRIQVLERGHQGPDHPLHIAIPETDYLKSIIVRKQS